MGGSFAPCVFGSVTRIPRPWVVVNILPKTPVLLLAGKRQRWSPTSGVNCGESKIPTGEGEMLLGATQAIVVAPANFGMPDCQLLGLLWGLGRGVDGRGGRPRFAAAVATAFQGCFEMKTAHEATGSHQIMCGCGCMGCERRGDMGYGQLWVMGMGYGL